MEVEKTLEAEIDALLAQVDGASVVDALLAIPPHPETTGEADEWQKLLHARLQTKVSRRMQENLAKRSSGEPA
mgnify:CR=1 FL=1